jgi:hypothetical protein
MGLQQRSTATGSHALRPVAASTAHALHCLETAPKAVENITEFGQSTGVLHGPRLLEHASKGPP